MAVYDNYVWRLQAVSEAIDLVLPKDLRFIDEFTRSAISQKIEYSLTGAAIITESQKKTGLPITLIGFDSMAWVNRTVIDSLIILRDTPSLQMKLQFVDYTNNVFGSVHPKYNFDVVFRHSDQPVLDFDSVKGFDDFETDSYFKVKSLKFTEVLLTSAMNPCSANVDLNLINITGTFNIGEGVTGANSGTTGTVLGWDSPILHLYVQTGEFITSEVITGPSGSGTIA
jgi:hypothetical protein